MAGAHGDGFTYVVGWIYAGSSTISLYDVARSRRPAVPNVTAGISQEVPQLLRRSAWSDGRTLQCRSWTHGHVHRRGLSARPSGSRGQG